MVKYRVVFKPEVLTIDVEEGTSIAKAAEIAGIVLDSPCGGRGTCGKCKVKIITDSLVEPTETERKLLTDREISQGFRLACQTVISSNAEIYIPEESRIRAIKVLSEGSAGEIKLHPNVSKIYMEVPPQTLENQVSDLTNIKEVSGLKDLSAELDVLRSLPKVLRSSKYKVTLVVSGNKLIGVEPGDTSKKKYGIAIDIGTTTVVCNVIDLNTGYEKGVASALNAQATHGADVVSRINYTIGNERGLEELGDKVMQVINQIIEYACAEANVDPMNVYEATIVGNTTMTHLFLKLPVRNLAVMPYVGVVSDPVEVKASDLGFNIYPNANIYVLPNIAGFVGADTVGVILSTSLHKSDEIKLAIDIGTNGEIVLGSKHRLLACSTAAGPAFEGAMITHGMRGAPGAIERVRISDRPEYQVIQGGNPIGICGSGLIDVVAEMLRLGIVDPTGKMHEYEELSLPEKLRNYIRKDDEYGLHLVLYEGNGHKVVVTQRDVRQVQLAKGAIKAGVQILMKRLGVKLEDVSEVLLAGAFGNYIRKESAIRMGLLPDFPLERVRFIGNAAAAGAKMALISKEARQEAIKISKFTEYVELATDPEFQDKFMEAMMFPEGD